MPSPTSRTSPPRLELGLRARPDDQRRSLGILTLFDEYTKESLVTFADSSIRAVDVIDIVTEAMELRARVAHLLSDNGSEYFAYAIQYWLREHSVMTIHIKPGALW